MNNELQNTPENIANPQRRSMLKAAAWAAPVVAIAATAPLAAASAVQAVWSASITGTLAISNGNRLAGDLAGNLQVTGVTGNWETGVITSRYTFTGDVDGPTITHRDGSPFVNGPFQHNGVNWIVSVISPSDIRFQADSIRYPGGLYSIQLPPARFTGTYTGNPPSGQAVAAASFRAANINKNVAVSNQSPYPSDEW